MTDLAPGSRVGPYTIVEQLPFGRGGMAMVCRASIQLPGKPAYLVALKVMRAQSTTPQEERFFSDAINNEVQILKQLHHPNIVRIFPIPLGGRRQNPVIARDTQLPGSPWYFVMEYLDGGALHKLIKQRKLSLEESVEIASQIGLALAYMHSKGIAHRDVKPDNVLFRSAPATNGRIEPVLVDFGIAAKLERVGLQAGSIYYMSPERLLVVRGQVAPERHIDQAAADVYSLGAMLYQMLTGRRPFEGRSHDSITTAILHSDPALPRQINAEVSTELEELLMATLSKTPASRPTADDFVARLDQLVPPPRVLTPVRRPPAARRSSILPWLISAASTAALLGLLAFNLLTGAFVGDPERVETPVVATEQPTRAAATRAPTREPSPTGTAIPTATRRPSPTATARPTLRPTKQGNTLATPTRLPTRTPTNTLPPPTSTPQG